MYARIPFKEKKKENIIKNCISLRGFLLDLVTYWHPLKYFSSEYQANFICIQYICVANPRITIIYTHLNMI